MPSQMRMIQLGIIQCVKEQNTINYYESIKTQACQLWALLS